MNSIYKNPNGQAVFELIIVLPVFIFLIILGFQVFRAIDGATLMQKEVQKEIYAQIDNRANGGIDQKGRELATQTIDPVHTEGLPMIGSQTQSQKIHVKIGMCRTEACGP